MPQTDTPLNAPSNDLLDDLCRILERTGWAFFSLPAAASQLNLPLQTIQIHFSSCEDVLEAFFERTHAAVRQSVPHEFDLSFEEKLLESLMSRFDTLESWKHLVQKLTIEGLTNPCLGGLITKHVTKSWGEILPRLHQQTTPLALPLILFIHGKCLHQWLNDTTEGAAQTLAQADTLIRRFSFLMTLNTRSSNT